MKMDSRKYTRIILMTFYVFLFNVKNKTKWYNMEIFLHRRLRRVMINVTGKMLTKTMLQNKIHSIFSNI